MILVIINYKNYCEKSEKTCLSTKTILKMLKKEVKQTCEIVGKVAIFADFCDNSARYRKEET